MAMNTLPAGVRPANPARTPGTSDMTISLAHAISYTRAGLRRLIAAIEPWYNWGTINVERMQGLTRERSNGEGDVSFVELQFLGVHVGVQLGRTPAARRG